MKDTIIKKLKNHAIILDGAMGTMLQAMGVETGKCPELLNIENPDVLFNIHKQYVDAGSNIILANTFGASRIKLAEYGQEGKIKEINKAAIKTAKSALTKDTYIACSIGPTGKLSLPVGDVTFDTFYNNYREQIEICLDEGVDIIAFETFSDIKELRAAVIAANDITKGSLPIFAMMSFQENLRTVLGTSAEAAYITLDGLGVDAIGANCSLGPDVLIKIIENFSHLSEKPLIVQPNAGMPTIINNNTTYPASPKDMVKYVKRFIELGVRVIGGCCGTTPEHIRQIAEEAKNIKVSNDSIKTGSEKLLISCRNGYSVIGGNETTKKVGERINPTGKPDLIEELKSGKMSKVIELARTQLNDGADILDVNVGAPNADELSLMPKAILAVSSTVNIPLMIDSQDPLVIEAGLKEADGKVIVNSVTAEGNKLDSILPLVKKYGAAVLALTIDDNGIPETVEERVRIAEVMIKKAKEFNILPKDIIIDCLSLAASAKQDQAKKTLEAVKVIKERCKCSTILGISNVSFGLPERKFLNSSFLSMSISYGLDAAIVNPSDVLVKQGMNAADVLTNRDKNAKAYIDNLKGGTFNINSHSKENNKTSATKKKTSDSTEDKIYNAVMHGDKDSIGQLIELAIKEGKEHQEIGDKILIPALREVGNLFEKKIYFLPQMILSAEVMQIAFDKLKEIPSDKQIESNETIIIATVKGDIHDIGKNIVVTMLKNYGYNVIDLGKNISADIIVKSAIDNNADIIGLSALMTTTMTEMKEIINRLKEDKVDIQTIIGGAVVTQKYADEIGASAYAKDALDAVKKVESLIEKRVEIQ